MANKVSAEKRARQNPKRRARNRTIRSAYKSAVKTAKAAIDSGSEPKAAAAQVSEAQGVVARAAKTNAIHHRKAARITSRLMKRANKAAAKK